MPVRQAVDETHSFGVQGPQERGLTADLGLIDFVHFQLVGLSKSFASRGGIAAGSNRNIKYLRGHSFPAIFSTQVMPHEVAGYNAALTLIQNADLQRTEIRNLHQAFVSEVARIGFNVSASDRQIVAIESGSERETIRFRDFTQRRGLFGSVYCWPATSKNRSLIRFTINSQLTMDEVQRASQILRTAFVELNAKDWQSTKRLSR